MPQLDRLITIRIYAPGMFNAHGEFVPGEATDHPGIWCRFNSSGSVEIDDGSGIRTASRKTFLIRFRRDVIEAGPLRVEVIDEYNVTYDIDQIDESNSQLTRRRFIEMTGQEILT